MNSYVITCQDELQHHGILGQKWGVRRYQNSDGTLTSAGKKRYNTSDNHRKVSDVADDIGENIYQHKNAIKRGAIIGGMTLSAVSVLATANNLAATNAILADSQLHVAPSEVIKLGSVALGKAAVKGMLVGGATGYVSDVVKDKKKSKK